MADGSTTELGTTTGIAIVGGIPCDASWGVLEDTTDKCVADGITSASSVALLGRATAEASTGISAGLIRTPALGT